MASKEHARGSSLELFHRGTAHVAIPALIEVSVEQPTTLGNGLTVRGRERTPREFVKYTKGKTSMAAHVTGFVGDIGATNARFALVRSDKTIDLPRVFASDEYPSIADAIVTFIQEQTSSDKPSQGVLAIAAPVINDSITMTNHPWSFSVEKLRRRLGLTRLRVINDFVANALAIPHLGSEDCTQIGSGSPVADAPVGIIGPGTGLGMSGLVIGANGEIPIHGEGGHVTMAPADARESAVLDLMRRRYDHISAERALSGQGLINLYNTLCELSGTPSAPFSPAQITDPRIGEEDTHAREATGMFCSMLGTVAGNLALTLGARRGIYIAGGIVPKLGIQFVNSRFRERFESKGRFRNYLAAIPTYVITRPAPALIGAAKLLEQS